MWFFNKARVTDPLRSGLEFESPQIENNSNNNNNNNNFFQTVIRRFHPSQQQQQQQEQKEQNQEGEEQTNNNNSNNSNNKVCSKSLGLVSVPNTKNSMVCGVNCFAALAEKITHPQEEEEQEEQETQKQQKQEKEEFTDRVNFHIVASEMNCNSIYVGLASRDADTKKAMMYCDEPAAVLASCSPKGCFLWSETLGMFNQKVSDRCLVEKKKNNNSNSNNSDKLYEGNVSVLFNAEKGLIKFECHLPDDENSSSSSSYEVPEFPKVSFDPLDAKETEPISRSTLVPVVNFAFVEGSGEDRVTISSS